MWLYVFLIRFSATPKNGIGGRPAPTALEKLQEVPLSGFLFDPLLSSSLSAVLRQEAGKARVYSAAAPAALPAALPDPAQEQPVQTPSSLDSLTTGRRSCPRNWETDAGQGS